MHCDNCSLLGKVIRHLKSFTTGLIIGLKFERLTHSLFTDPRLNCNPAKLESSKREGLSKGLMDKDCKLLLNHEEFSLRNNTYL